MDNFSTHLWSITLFINKSSRQVILLQLIPFLSAIQHTRLFLLSIITIQPVAPGLSSCPYSDIGKVKQTLNMAEDSFVEEFDDTSIFENKAGLAEVRNLYY